MTTEQLTDKKPFISPDERRTFDVKKINQNGYTSANNGFKEKQKYKEFYELCTKVSKYIYEIYDEKVEQKKRDETDENYVEIYHNAMSGIPEDVKRIKKHIEHFVQNNGFKDTIYPAPYSNLVNGIFEEEYGWGPLSVFKQEIECEGAQSIGREISIKRKWGYETLPFKFRSEQHALDVCDRFSNLRSDTKLNKHSNPEVETRTYEGYRVSIMIPDRTFREPVITLRRSIVKDYTFETLASYGTFPFEAINVLKDLTKLKANSVVAGPPGCGKSTLLQTQLGHLLYEERNGKRVPERLKTIFGEPNPEFDVRSLFEGVNVIHLIGNGEEFEKEISKYLLRHDISRVALGEMREHEVGLYRRSSLQGLKQVMGTLHDLDPIDIAEIMTSLYLQYYGHELNPDVVYKAFSKNLHYSISMDEFLEINDQGEDELKKRLTSVQIYDFDSVKFETKMHTIMKYNEEKGSWTYNSDLPERFKRLVKKYNRKELNSLEDELKRLEEISPMPEEERIETGVYLAGSLS